MRTANWHRALDIQMDALKWHREEYGQNVIVNYLRSVYENAARLDGTPLTTHELIMVEAMLHDDARLVTQTLHRADTCYITSDMLHLVLQAAHDMPDDQIQIDFRNLMTPCGFVLLEEPISGEDRNGSLTVFNAMAWNSYELRLNPHTSEMERCLVLHFYADTYDDTDGGNLRVREICQEHGIPVPPLTLLHMFYAFDGHIITHNELPGGAIVEELLKVFYAIQLLSHQTIGEPMQLRPDRGTRKRFARDFPDEPERLITLITLRRKTVKKDDEPDGTVEWQSRWVVRGHWRRQWYPKLKRHDWKYIHEYIKGPEDKPLRLTERRVFDFRR